MITFHYRNTRQTLQLAYEFAQHYLQEHASDEDHLPLIIPESGGVNGALPIVREFSNPDDEPTLSPAARQGIFGVVSDGGGTVYRLLVVG